MIKNWLDRFKEAWLAKDIDTVLELFSDDVEYWENPFKKIGSHKELAKEWEVIKEQENLVISTSIYASNENKHTVIWGITYDKGGEQKVWSGVYLIELNDEGFCEFFQQIGEKNENT